jgi:hypothetical protein
MTAGMVTADIVWYITEDFGAEEAEAMKQFYGYGVFEKLMDFETGLYRESPADTPGRGGACRALTLPGSLLPEPWPQGAWRSQYAETPICIRPTTPLPSRYVTITAHTTV